MTTDGYELRSTSDIDPKDLIMLSKNRTKMWEKQELMSIGRFREHASIYDTDLSVYENTEAMVKMFVNLPTEVITQGVSRIREEFAKFFCAEWFKDSLEEKDSPLALLHGIQECFIIIQI